MLGGGVAVNERAGETALPQVQRRPAGRSRSSISMPGHARAPLGERDEETSVGAADVEHARPPAPESPPAERTMPRQLLGRGAAARIRGRGVLEVERKNRMVGEGGEVSSQGLVEAPPRRARCRCDEALGDPPPGRRRGRRDVRGARFHRASRAYPRGAVARLSRGAA